MTSLGMLGKVGASTRALASKNSIIKFKKPHVEKCKLHIKWNGSNKKNIMLADSKGTFH